MNKIQLIKAIIQKAIDSGWEEHLSNFGINDAYIRTRLHMKIIFDPEFAKAFFGTGDLPDKENKQEFYQADDLGAQFVGEKWEYHMQQYVILEEPLAYFKDFV